MAVRHVLIVEDQRDLARMIRSGLQSLSHEYLVLDVPSGEEALLVAGRYPLDVLIIDVKLPGISGLELMRKLKRHRPELKVILITGLTEREVRDQVTRAGADAFFFKPVELSEILSAVEALLGNEAVAPVQPGDAEPPPAPNLSERLTTLRKDLAALVTLILDERGQVLVQAGALPALEGESPVIPALMAAFSTSERLSLVLGADTPQDLLRFSGPEFDLYLAHLGPAHALLAATPRSPQETPTAETLVILQGATRQLIDILARLGVPVQSEVQPATGPLEPAVDAPQDELQSIDLETVLSQASELPQEPVDVDAFWEPDDKIDTGGLSPDALTYDQAHKLGLTPEEDRQE